MAWRKKIGIFPWHQNTHLKLLTSGQPFFQELLHLIEISKSEIHFHVYIFDHDHTGKIVKEALVRAAERGVQIKLWMDAYGSSFFPDSWKRELQSKGAEINFYSKFKFAFRYHIGIRLHHKIFIFDQKTALLGGINISDHYSHLGHEKPWLDFGIRVEGNVVFDLIRICLNIEKGAIPLSRKEKQQLVYKQESGPYKARILQNHWSKAKFGISRQYRQKIRRAQKEIIFVASYFVPSLALKRLLKKAATRGVKVQLILGGKSDVGLAKYASSYLYGDLLKAGVEILEWQPSVMHAKLAFIDDSWMCIGSYNLNYLSDFGSVECNIEIRNQEFQELCKYEVDKMVQENSIKINALDYLKKIGWFQKSRNLISYILFAMALKILFFFQK